MKKYNDPILDCNLICTMSNEFLLICLFFGLTVQAQTTTKSTASEKPNIVLFFVDDLGWTDLGFRNPNMETPNIDQLAKEGLSFQQAYVASPTCSPSRSTLLTGKHPARLKMVRHIPTGLKHPDFDEFGRTEIEYNLWKTDPAQFPCRNWLPLEHTTYAEALRDKGYFNLFVGKWHLGHEEYHPIKQGFDQEIGTSNWGHPKSYYPPYFINSEVFADEKERYLTDKLTDEAIGFIENYNKDQPFMISMWYYGVHKPNIGRKDLVKYFESKGLKGADAHYAAQIKSVDVSVGRIRSVLKQKGVDQNTIILFTSDQGSWFENLPYRGCKRKETLFEGGARVPFLVLWPGVTKPGGINNSIVQTTDIFPTLVEVSGGDPNQFKDLDGISLAPIIVKNKKLKRSEPIYAYRAYEDLYVSVREGPWKLLVYRSGKKYLFNVEKDRFEQIDLAEKKKKKRKNLVNKLKRWEVAMDVHKYSGVK